MMDRVRLMSPTRYSQINIPVVCAVLFMYVAFSHAIDPGTYIFRENNKDAVVKMTLPDFNDASSVVRLNYGDGGKQNFLFLDESRTKVSTNFNNIVTTKKEGTQLLIKFSVMKFEYAQTYSCYKETTDEPVNGCGFKIVVLAKPSQPEVKVSEDSSLLVGGTATLDCEFKSNTMPLDHGLKPLVRWFDGKGIEMTRSSLKAKVNEDGRLVLKGITRDDRGMVFACSAVDDPEDKKKEIYSERSAEFLIEPEYPPGDSDFTLKPHFENNTVIKRAATHNVRYECQVDCQPACDISWKTMTYGADTYIDMPATEMPEVLEIEGLARKDQGAYMCEAENKHGSNSQNFILEVLYLLTPNIVVTGTKAKRKIVLEGEMEEVDLTCHIYSNPQPTVVWKNPENWLINQSTLSGPDIYRNNSLQIHRYSSDISLKDVKCENGGFYKCQADNGIHNTMTGEFELEVKCQPSAVESGQYEGLAEKDVLQEEYVWELGSFLRGDFVIRGWPSPRIKRVESILDGVLQEESMYEEVKISTQHPYMNRQYLTRFTFDIERMLTFEDRGRVFRFILENTDFETKFSFAVQPRGPPLPVSSLNVTKVSHNAVTISWVPEFDGGEMQTFSVSTREADSDDDWEPADARMEESDNGLVKAKLKSLSARTSYEVMVMSTNSRGSTNSSIVILTLGSPASSANTGAIVGAVFAVIVLLIVAAILFYIFIYRKRWGKGGDGESGIPMIGRMSKMFRGKNRDPNGNENEGKMGSGSDSKKSKFRPIFTGKSKPPKDYLNVPTESTDPTDSDYANADSITRKQPLDPNEQMSEPDPMDDEKDEGRVVTDDGLTYVKLDFRGKPPQKPRRLESQESPAANGDGDACAYSSIDFEKTKAQEELKRLEEEEARQREEERRRKAAEDAEQPYENFESFGTTV